jgi:light-regulated signal transduction histidine kinase (bacteriophytochrome)
LDRSEITLDSCEQEAIHRPGAIQPHGALIVLHPTDLTVLQASRNACDFFGADLRLGGPVPATLSPIADDIKNWQNSSEAIFQTEMPDATLTAHRSGGLIVLEIERSAGQALGSLFARLRGFAQVLSAQDDVAASLAAAARFVHDLTGFDRVLVYKFDDNWNGRVVAEAGNGRLPSYLDLRFPAGDIPAQARALYAANRLRIIPNVSYEPVPIDAHREVGTDVGALDLSFSQLRSVSPVHLEYMRNMGTAASMSVSIIIDGRLWGLVACHSAEPHMVAVTVRDACDFIVQSLAMRISAQVHSQDASRRVELARISGHLLRAMTSALSWSEGLETLPEDLIAQVGAPGAAIISQGDCHKVGTTPSDDEIRSIVRWLSGKAEEDMFATTSLAAEFPAAVAFAGEASGIIAIRLSELYENWLIWFRPEVIRTVQWAGDPHEIVQEKGRIHPRKSFQAWSENVRLHSLAWTEAELSAARDLRNAIVGIVLRKAEELAELTSELQRSNKELEAFSYSVSHDLRAPFRHIVGFAQLLRDRENSLDDKSRHYLETISDSALAAGRLVDDLLNFSQLGRASITHNNVDMNKLVAEVVKSVMLNHGDRVISWSIEQLPTAWGDATLLRQVWFNIIENAVKYSRNRNPSEIRVEGSVKGDATIYRVSDNGVGFDMAYVGKLFGVFQRLQRAEDFEGTGIGLALVRRIVERHNGSISAHGEVDKGASFVFALPGPEKKGRAFA